MITTDIQRAAEVLTSGGVVAFPTETVYGLGADALNADAIAKVYALKGRPSNNPLILHVSSIEMARSLVREWPEKAQSLAKKNWPGPLTIVLGKREAVPSVATGGGTTVALRMPAHETARKLIETFGGPIVGPSANPSGGVSPTTAEHVEHSFTGRVLVLDGGACARGLESTVVRIDGDTLEVLRPGVIGWQELGAQTRNTPPPDEGPLPAPGMLTRHYAPRTPVRLVRDASDLQAEDAVVLAHGAGASGARVIRMPAEAEAYGARLYAALREADESGASVILIEFPDGEGPVWEAIRDRLRRASATG